MDFSRSVISASLAAVVTCLTCAESFAKANAVDATAIQECKQLTAATGQEHRYGKGRLTAIAETTAIMGGEGMPDPTAGPDGMRVYSVSFTDPGISPRPKMTYLRGSTSRFEAIEEPIAISRRYGFCYVYITHRVVGIPIESFHRLSE